MNYDNLITVIVPVYNVEKYLLACIRSIQNQTYDNFELILVDDGSTDLSGEICDICASKDSRIIVIHQKNSGLSAARNKGIHNANGLYISFIDSDDYVAPDYIERLYLALKEKYVQISICDFKKVNENVEFSDLEYDEISAFKTLKLTNEEAIKHVYSSDLHGIDFISVAKLYDINLFRDNKILFPIGKIHEDAFTTYKLFYAADNIAYTDKPMYFYRIREGSITTSSFSLRRLDKLQATREECEFFKVKGNYDLLRLALFDHLHENKVILKYMSETRLDFRISIKEVSFRMGEDIKKYSQYVSIPLKKKLYYTILSKFPFKIILKL